MVRRNTRVLCTAITTKGHPCTYKASRLIDERHFCKTHYNIYLDSNKECCICLDTIATKKESTTTPCQHTFHKQCLKKWEHSNGSGFKTCPLCRTPIFRDRIFEKLKSVEVDYLKFLQWLFITLTSIEHLTPEEVHIEISNKSKYTKLLRKSPGLQDIMNKWSVNGDASDTAFFIEKNRINFELAKFDEYQFSDEIGVHIFAEPAIRHVLLM